MAKGKSITTKRVQATEGKPFSLPEVEAKPEEEQAPWVAEGLTKMQLDFVEALCGRAGGCPTRAARAAGYSQENYNALRATASRLLTFVNVKSAIARRMARGNLTPEWVREMTAALAASNMGSFLSVGDDGEPRVDWKEAQRAGALVQIRKFKEKSAKSGETVVVIDRTIETHSPAPYLNLLARILGLVSEPQPAGGVSVNVAVNNAPVDYDAIERELRRIVKGAAVGRVPADN